jgi:hypothetical protein
VVPSGSAVIRAHWKLLWVVTWVPFPILSIHLILFFQRQGLTVAKAGLELAILLLHLLSAGIISMYHYVRLPSPILTESCTERHFSIIRNRFRDHDTVGRSNGT